MRALYLIRHSLTRANELRLYGGSTDIPLTEQGRAIAIGRRGAIPDCEICVSSGMRRADETLALMTGRGPDLVLPGLKEMDFGAFEGRSADELADDVLVVRGGIRGLLGDEFSGLLRLVAVHALAVGLRHDQLDQLGIIANLNRGHMSSRSFISCWA